MSGVEKRTGERRESNVMKPPRCSKHSLKARMQRVIFDDIMLCRLIPRAASVMMYGRTTESVRSILQPGVLRYIYINGYQVVKMSKYDRHNIFDF